MRRVAFIDESGRKAPCNRVVVAAVVAEVRGSYLYWGHDLLARVSRAVGADREVKWRTVRRRGAVGVALSVLRGLERHWTAVHYTGQDAFEAALWRFLTRLNADLHVLDEGLANPSKFPRAVSRPSHRVPGLQLADLLAGCVADGACGESP